MNHVDSFCPPRPRRGPPLALLRLLLPLLAIGLLGVFAPRAVADGCKGCTGPTLDDLRKEPGFGLPHRENMFGTSYRDHYLLDRGECVSKATGLPDIQRLRTWLVLRGEGEVWDCPHSKSTDTITITASEADSTAWSFSSSVGFEMSAPGVKVKAQVQEGETTGVTITEVTTVSKSITPGWCHRIAWSGYFEVGLFQATATFIHKQRWRWWTKNTTTGAAVHASGDIWMSCGSSAISLDRQAPISGYFELSQRGCESDLCRYILPKYLGFFPALPPHLIPAYDDPDDASDDDPSPTADDGGAGTTNEPDEGNPVEPPEPDTSNPDEQDESEDPPLSSGELGLPPSGPLPNPLGRG